MCCTSDSKGSVQVWLLQFEVMGAGDSSLHCTQCELIIKLAPLAEGVFLAACAAFPHSVACQCWWLLQSAVCRCMTCDGVVPAGGAPLTINCFCGDRHSARLVRWQDSTALTHMQLHIEATESSLTCPGCSMYGGCCSCCVCGGIGTPHPAADAQRHHQAKIAVDGGFQICHKLVHEIQFKEFGRTTAVAVCGKLVFAGSDTGAVAAWECGVGGAVERVAGWWLEGESVSMLLPARAGHQLFILVGMHGGSMYSFDTASQLP